jgi:hypothetical protein
MWSRGCLLCGTTRTNNAVSPDASYQRVPQRSFGPESPQNTIQIQHIIAAQLEPKLHHAVQRLAIEEAVRGGGSGDSSDDSSGGGGRRKKARSGDKKASSGGSGERNRGDSPGGSADVADQHLVKERQKAIIELHRRRIHIELLQEEVRRERAAVDELIVAIAIA